MDWKSWVIHLYLAHYMHHSSKFIWLLWQSCLNKILQISWTPAWVLIFSCFLFSRCTMLWLLEHLRCRQFLQKKGWSCKIFCDFLCWCWEGLSVSIICKKTSKTILQIFDALSTVLLQFARSPLFSYWIHQKPNSNQMLVSCKLFLKFCCIIL